MRLIIVILILDIYIVVYTKAAALPKNPSADKNFVPEDTQFNELEKGEPFEYTPEDEQNLAKTPQSRTLFLLLPLLFPDQFYF